MRWPLKEVGYGRESKAEQPHFMLVAQAQGELAKFTISIPVA
jgi:hypothetical protein